MDSRDLIVLGLVGVGGWLAYRWWKAQPIANAQNTAPDEPAGAAASSMTGSAARTTVFGGMLARKLLDPIGFGTVRPKLPAPTGSAVAVVADQAPAYFKVQRQVSSAVLGPMPVAPSPNNFRFTSTGVMAPISGTAPSGDQPSPGDPSPFTVMQTAGIA